MLGESRRQKGLREGEEFWDGIKLTFMLTSLKTERIFQRRGID